MEKGRRILACLPEKHSQIIINSFREFDFAFSNAMNGADVLEQAITRSFDGLFLWEEVPVLPLDNLLTLLRNNPKLARRPIFVVDSKVQAARVGGHGEIRIPSVMGREAVSRVLKEFGIQADFDPEQTFGLGESYDQIPLADFIQIVEQNHKTGRLVIEGSPHGGVIFFREGAPVRTELDNGVVFGNKAFFRLLNLDSPRIFFKETQLIPEEDNIDRPLQYLLLEAARIGDEYRIRADAIGPFRNYEPVIPEGASLEALDEGEKNLFLLIQYHEDLQRALDFSVEDDATLLIWLGRLIEQGFVVARRRGSDEFNVNEVRVLNALQSLPFADGTILIHPHNPDFVGRTVRFFERIEVCETNTSLFFPDRNSGSSLYIKTEAGSLLILFSTEEGLLKRLIGPRRTLLAECRQAERRGRTIEYLVAFLQGGRRFVKIPWQADKEAPFWQELLESLS